MSRGDRLVFAPGRRNPDGRPVPRAPESRSVPFRRLMARLLVLGASVSQLPLLRCARAAGHWVLAVDADARAVGFALANATVTVDFSEIGEGLQAAGRHRVE